MLSADSKLPDGLKASPVDPEFGGGNQRNKILDAAITLRQIGCTTFVVVSLYSILEYVLLPSGSAKRHLPGLTDWAIGLSAQWGSTTALGMVNKIKKRETDVVPPVVFGRERLLLVLGFALVAGALVGSIVNLILNQYSYFSYANVFQCVAIVTSLTIVLVEKGYI